MNDQSGVGKLTDEEAKEMLEKLSRHFWASAWRMKVERAKALAESKPESCIAAEDLEYSEKFADEIGHVFMMIDKSNLLARLIYEDESLRTEMCPIHKGIWSG